MNAPAQIPDGYLRDAQGRLVPQSIIPDHELLSHHLVGELVAECEASSAQLAALKAQLLERVAEHIALVATNYQVSISGKSGDVRLENYDSTARIERISAQRTVVGEQIHAAEELVRQYLAEETVGASESLRAIVDRTFRRNQKTGELNVSRLIDFANVEIDDERWRRAQQAIRDALRSAGSVTYFRAYRRAEAGKPWEQVPLDFSSLDPAAEAAQ
jgi:hypothetical protein